MKFVIYITVAVMAIIMPVTARNIHYGYNAQGEYVPTEINGQRVQYGYNAQGEYVPTAIGNERVEYGYNPQGEYVPYRPPGITGWKSIRQNESPPP